MRKNGFTLTELLVVIAVISVLAAMLLPSLENALEQSRRIVCANNQKQIYLASSLYADDFADRLPFRTDGVFRRSIGRAQLNLETAKSPLRTFWRDYAGVGIGTAQYSTGFQLPDSIAHCPSAPMLTVDAGWGAVYWQGFSSYNLLGMGVASQTDAAEFGAPRFSVIARGGPAGRFCMLQDMTVLTLMNESVPETLGFNHRFAGSNAMAADGTLRWYGAERLVNTTGGWYAVRDLYSPEKWGITTGSRQLGIWAPPNGTMIGYSTEYRKFYGLR